MKIYLFNITQSLSYSYLVLAFQILFFGNRIDCDRKCDQIFTKKFSILITKSMLTRDRINCQQILTILQFRYFYPFLAEDDFDKEELILDYLIIKQNLMD
ncbi:hypothetical protein BpHYR1_049660 [Brachionus plicatilis]|uniref:Uncharacterized protein n=1 Tax=Brachionus plicatilis TaxID=10195 RepID=A0A3M7R5E6_BRAPC|nr:hypothetical protein BpHYR1_049660 [Brachionus plicatilis]